MNLEKTRSKLYTRFLNVQYQLKPSEKEKLLELFDLFQEEYNQYADIEDLVDILTNIEEILQ